MPTSALPKLLAVLAEETSLQTSQVANTVELLDGGATVPFVARYRKERTGELDEVQIRTLEERLAYHRALDERRQTILATIDEQGRLTPELRARIDACRQKTDLEDLYLPYKPKRRTKAALARERGLEPLAERIVAQKDRTGSLEGVAAPFVGGEVPDSAAALEGAEHILAERLSEDAAVRARVRQLTGRKGQFTAKVAPKHVGTVTKYELYYDHQESVAGIPSHRLLALLRGEAEGVLRLTIAAPTEEILGFLTARLVTGPSLFAELLKEVAEDAYKRLLAPAIETELRHEAKARADQAAIAVFAENLRNLLLAAPGGDKRVLGIDPGLRTGSKLAAVDGTGRFLAHATVYPHTGAGQVPKAKQELVGLVRAHRLEMVAVGNGTASREMERFVRDALAEAGLELPVVIVSEAGASVYSASDIAREEFPELDLTVRGAISIARRLQDPLAELVKLDAKSIGVGQYQHDVDQKALQHALDATVESCVNHVGVDLNTASWALLAYVSGIGEKLAKAVVAFRDEHGSFASRQELLKVPRLGAKAFEQAAGFLRVRGGKEPLDNTAVHPENYPLVQTMARDLGTTVAALAADPDRVARIDLTRYVTDSVGLPTLRDIAVELKKPGRDPRETFQAVTFRDDVREIGDLKEGMVLQGTVTNVAAFGAFVDLGVHQDGLVHISQLADRYVKDPGSVVRIGQIVRVKVLSVDPRRKRIGLSMKALAEG